MAENNCKSGSGRRFRALGRISFAKIIKTAKPYTGIIAALAALFCVLFVFAGCSVFRKQEKSVTIVYHLNGGLPSTASLPDENGDYTDVRTGRDVENGVYLMVPHKETWLFEGWFLEDSFQNKYEPPMNIIPADECDGGTKHLYAKWTDRIVITPQNFTDYFQFSSKWNGGLTTANASVSWSIAPKTTNVYSSGDKYVFNPQLSQTIEIEMRTKGDAWALHLNADSYYEFSGGVSGFSAGQTVGSAVASVSYTVLEGAYELYLLHKDPFTVTLDLDGGTCQGETEFELLGGDVLEYGQLPVPAKEGYRLMGWASAKHSDGKPVAQNATITAQWRKEHVLSYELNGDILSAITLLDGDGLVLPKLAEEGSEFFGWYYDSEFMRPIEYNGYSESDECIYPFNIAVHEDLTVFARFETIYEIAFETNGGTAKDPIYAANTETPNLGDSPGKQGPNFERLYFGGWFLDENFETEYKAQPVSQNLILYAQWLQAKNIGKTNVEDFFDIATMIEHTSYTENGLIRSALKLTVSIALKQEFRGYRFYFYSSMGADVSFYDADSVFLGGISVGTDSLSNCTVAHLLNGSVEVFFRESGKYEDIIEKYVYDYKIILLTDHIRVSDLGTGTIYFPEGVEL
ncbi:MAG: InlB B-repeat-containing protein [Clostridiales bacterium]|jgi:uncharacterized repeat protein (TIGR02543 family)|nr:InlB B-repeat-containing protein [Clostridiales bacterium]